MNNILKTALSLKSSTCLRIPSAYRRGQRGQLLIMLIITMVIMSILSAAMVYIFSSSTLNTVFANYSQRAYYSAEAGARYAMARYRHTSPQMTTAQFTALTGTTVTFPNNNGQAILTIVDSMNNATTVPTATPASAVTVPVGGNLSVTGDVTHFPTINGFFRINGTTLLRYKSRVNNLLQVVTGQAASGITLSTTDSITVPLGQVAITSKGFYPVAGIFNMSRTIVYGWIMSGYSGGNDVQNPQNPNLAANDGTGIALGQWSQVTPGYNIDGGGGALQPIKASGLAVSFLPTTESAYLQEAWYNQGGFLSYLGQVKVATGTLVNTGGNNYTLSPPQPTYYGGGLTFRDQGKDNPGQWRGYGLVFYRGPVAGVNTPTVPPNTNLVDLPLIYLTVRNSNGDLRPMAYAQIPTTDLVLEQIAGWVLNTHYVVNAKVTVGGTYYLCISENTAAAINQPGAGPNWTTYWKTDTQHLNNWSTMAVDVQEAASITLNSDPGSGFEIGKSVSNQNGATGVVIDKIYTLSGNPVLLLNGSNGVGVGTFAVNDTVVQGAISATVAAFLPRDNYIRAYYGDKNSTQIGNITSLDIQNRRKYLRLTNPTGADFNWPTKNPTADNNIITGDLFTIVQWTLTANSVDGNVMQDKLIDENGASVFRRTIIRSSLLTTGTYVTLVPPELGIIAFGDDPVASMMFFDNFAYKLKGTSTGGIIIPPIQQ